MLRQTSLDAFVVSHPLNVYYATSKLPVLDRMSSTHQSVAVIPADPTQPVAYIGPAFEYYYNVADVGVADGVLVTLITPAAAEPLRAANQVMMRDLHIVPLEAREQRRRTATEVASFHKDIPAGLSALLPQLGIGSGSVGVDSMEAKEWLATATPELNCRGAADLMRHVRLVKTPAELDLLRLAAQANARALVSTIKVAREHRSFRALRERFFSEASLLGNTPIFMLIDGVMDEEFEDELHDGRAFLVDAVSHRGLYQGDYARTACIGAPQPEMLRVTQALELAWGEIRNRLRPGLRFSEIKAIGNETLRRLGYDYTVAFKPHSVGLTHEDQPTLDTAGRPHDLALVAGMVLSVDCPLLDVGVGGSAHLEDLTLITANGSEPLHTVDPALICV